MSRQRNVIQDMVARGATWSEATELLQYLVEWGLAEDRAGHPIKVEDYAAAADVSVATAYRRQQKWRAVFQSPNDVTPTRYWSLVPSMMKTRSLKRLILDVAMSKTGYE